MVARIKDSPTVVRESVGDENGLDKGSIAAGIRRGSAVAALVLAARSGPLDTKAEGSGSFDEAIQALSPLPPTQQAKVLGQELASRIARYGDQILRMMGTQLLAADESGGLREDFQERLQASLGQIQPADELGNAFQESVRAIRVLGSTVLARYMPDGPLDQAVLEIASTAVGSFAHALAEAYAGMDLNDRNALLSQLGGLSPKTTSPGALFEDFIDGGVETEPSTGASHVLVKAIE